MASEIGNTNHLIFNGDFGRTNVSIQVEQLQLFSMNFESRFVLQFQKRQKSLMRCAKLNETTFELKLEEK